MKGTGRWSDGSKEWTPEWLDALQALGHTFGDDGAFIMEYEDWLDTWTIVHRVHLFDPSWIMSSLWISAKLRGPTSAWDYGDVSCARTFRPSRPHVLTGVCSYVHDAGCLSSYYYPRTTR
jgi:hypothetical protein